MKLAEALVLRVDCQRKISQLRERLSRVVKVQEGDEPAEKPELLLQELNETINQLTVLIMSINKTNSLTPFDENRTIADVLAERDSVMQKRKILDELLEHASIRQDRYSRSEVRYQATVDIPKIQSEIDRLSKEYRELDFKIQEKNWTVNLVE
ncbi:MULTISPECIES: DIP1984 family protein [unclassified Paenibacillus]|uniref:DIP1984 family protein n=1 Tax=Paenibacillus TaxID=44249 RepID=UPI000BA542AA|nr:DIP1984 family protein [Paenibacillus sp. 7541]PAK51141.1 hypothetical protein CHH75_15585 [Paenibacillus sp. 7541]